MPGRKCVGMRLEIRHSCTDFNSYRAARVKSLFNATTGYNWSKDVELPIEGKEWQIGLIVGASGSGKTASHRIGCHINVFCRHVDNCRRSCRAA